MAREANREADRPGERRFLGVQSSISSPGVASSGEMVLT